ncbi:MAG: hypothetical protein E3J71_09695 [Candidatus Stahlbacteria bacterium]|nr:MAG: hypothetical protein E3J71_09695 [Candidatus Stahlbacteria bacterium]
MTLFNQAIIRETPYALDNPVNKPPARYFLCNKLVIVDIAILLILKYRENIKLVKGNFHTPLKTLKTPETGETVLGIFYDHGSS